VNNVSWYKAAAYCNWLSDREGISEEEWCYRPNAKGQYGPGMKPARDFLRRLGYRLPTEAEWEYACRAGALTSRYYGETEELLGRYAWYTKNALDRGMLPGVPAGIKGHLGVPGDQLRPNDFGLFDMLGNAQEWCQDPYFVYTTGDDKEFKEDIISENIRRVLRGGSFGYVSRDVRAANRNGVAPSDHSHLVGFRAARTFR
jgi:formylglycine-generating enzyme required for sulfatase activity